MKNEQRTTKLRAPPTAVIAGRRVTVRAPTLMDRILAESAAEAWLRLEGAPKIEGKKAKEFLVVAALVARVCTDTDGAELSISQVANAPDNEVSAVVKLLQLAP